MFGTFDRGFDRNRKVMTLQNFVQINPWRFTPISESFPLDVPTKHNVEAGQ